MATDLTPQIVQNAASPNSTSADGVSVTNNQISEQIAADKYLKANDAMSAIANGTGFFGRVRMVPPSARGDTSCD